MNGVAIMVAFHAALTEAKFSAEAAKVEELIADNIPW